MQTKTPANKLNFDSPCFAKLQSFGQFKPDQLETLISLSEQIGYEVSEKIIREDSAGDCMYVILSGEVAVTRSIEGEQVELGRLTTGDFFGEVALVDDGPRSASVTAITPCRLLIISRSVLHVLAGVQPGCAIHLLSAIGRNLVQRLRLGNQKYLDLILSGKIYMPSI